jgi:hypothetical protein
MWMRIRNTYFNSELRRDFLYRCVNIPVLPVILYIEQSKCIDINEVYLSPMYKVLIFLGGSAKIIHIIDRSSSLLLCSMDGLFFLLAAPYVHHWQFMNCVIMNFAAFQ